VDPWDPGTAFALVLGKWVTCRSKLRPTLSKYTEVERRYLFEEIAKRLGKRIGSLTPNRLEEWLHVMEPRNFDPKLAVQQEECKTLYEAMDMTQAISGDPALEPGQVPVMPLVVRRVRTHPSPEKQEQLNGRSALTQLEEESDDYTLF
jgi:hypothetical protein